MRNRISSGSVLTLGLCLASAAFALWAVQATALDPGPLHRDAREVLAESPVRHAMVTRVVSALSTTVPAGVAVDPTVLATVASGAIEQPAFVHAFAGALDRVQAHVVDGASGPITLNPALVMQAVRAAGAGEPQLAAALASSTPLVVQVPSDQVPDFAHWADLWRNAVRALAFFALLLVTYGMLGVDHRVWAIGRIGRWAIVTGVGTLAVFSLLPRVLLRPLGGWVAVGGAVLEAGDHLVPISLALIAAGAIVVVGAHRWEARDRQRLLAVIPHAATRSTAGSNPWESPV